MPRKAGVAPRSGWDEASEIARDNRDFRILRLALEHPEMKQMEIAAEVRCSVQHVNDLLREDARACPRDAIRDKRRQAREMAR